MSIERIQTNNRGASRSFEENVRVENAKTKKAMKSFLNNAGIFVGVLITFVVVIIVTTDIRLASLTDLSSLGIDFFLLLFCTYSMHVSCSDSGMRAALLTESYNECCEHYDNRKTYLIDRGYQTGLYSFCRHYVAEELKNARMNIIAVVGFTYEEYEAMWAAADREHIIKCEKLTKAQKKALLKAKKIKPITLLPEMFMRKGRLDGNRLPLGTDPEKKKKIHFGVKLSTMVVLSLAITMVAFDVVKEPSWAMVATAFLKLVVVIFNGFTGYKFGYENIVIDTVNYIADQTDLLEESIKYIENGRQVTCESETKESVLAISQRENMRSSSIPQTSPL